MSLSPELNPSGPLNDWSLRDQEGGVRVGRAVEIWYNSGPELLVDLRSRLAFGSLLAWRLGDRLEVALDELEAYLK